MTISTLAALEALQAAEKPVNGLALVDEPSNMAGHSFVKFGGQIVRIHWTDNMLPSNKAIREIALLIGQHCVPVCENPEVL